MMTRNEFELLAVAFKSARACIKTDMDNTTSKELCSAYDGFNIAINAVAEVCKANNSRFDKQRFMTAAGA